MAKKRATPRPQPQEPPAAGPVAALRLENRGSTDWAFDAEGWLILYDPAVVTAEVLDEFHGFQSLLRCALGWMNGDAAAHPILGEMFHREVKDRARDAARIARLTQLGWECALTVLPFCVALNGADIHFRSTPLTPEESKVHAAHWRQKNRGVIREPHPAWLITRGGRLGVTWDFLLGFKSAEKRAQFGPGYQVEVDWPAGAYAVKGWTFPPIEGEHGLEVDQYAVQLAPWS